MTRHVSTYPYKRSLCNGLLVPQYPYPWAWNSPGMPLQPVGLVPDEEVCPDCLQIIQDLIVAKEAGIDMEVVV